MRVTLLPVCLFALIISGSGCCCFVPYHGGGAPWAASPYEACVDYDPFYGPAPSSDYDKRTRRELRAWYRQMNRRGGPGRHVGGYGPGAGCACGACFNACDDAWCCDDACDVGAWGDCGIPCDMSCGAPIMPGCGGGFVMDYGAMDFGYGSLDGFSTCPTCQSHSFPGHVPEMNHPSSQYVPPPVRPFAPMGPIPNDGLEPAPRGNGPPSEAPMVPGGNAPFPRNIRTPDPVPVPAPIDPSAAAVRQMHYYYAR